MEKKNLTNLVSSNWLVNWLNQVQPPAELILLGTALLVGISTGVGAIIFRYLIQSVEWVSYQWIPAVTIPLGKSYVIFIPALGGLIVGSLIFKFAYEAKGSGIPEVMEAMALRNGRIRPIVAIVKAVASAITIGSGGAAGREGPIVQIGAVIGSSIGQRLNLSDDRVTNLVACGAAGGIAATFNAPIAGVIFALEVIMGGQFSVRYFSSVVVSAVAASVIGRAAFGDMPAFSIPFEYGVNSLWEFLFYPVLGILAAGIGVVFVRLLYRTKDFFDAWKRIPEWVKPAIGGVLLGILALLYPLASDSLAWDRTPHIFNVGYDVIEGALANELTLSVAAALLVLKLLATSLTLGSGGSGGVFAPSLFLGATLGAAFELLLRQLFPAIVTPSGAYALVGMAAVVAATAHAPITAVITLFELTGDYRIILPLMLTVVISTVFAQHLLEGESIFTLKLSRRGVRLKQGRDTDILQSVTVAEVMTKQDVTAYVDTSLSDLSEMFNRYRHNGLVVLDKEDKLWGIASITDLEKALLAERPSTTPVSEFGISWPYLKVTYPEETIGDALALMSIRGLGRLPVVSHDDPYHLLGVIHHSDIIKAYELALARRSEIHHKTHHIQKQTAETLEFIEIPVSPQDAVVNKTVQEVAKIMPNDCVLVSIRRDDKVIIPHGDTIFQAGDHITAFTTHEDAEKLFRCLHREIGEGETAVLSKPTHKI